MTEKVLFVDDEDNILSAFKRQFRKNFSIETAQSGEEGLNLLHTKGPFAVVISDFRMPGMDGIQFLSRASEIALDTVRIMLTGHADLNTAINAVNEGKIFRFLTKPCPPDVFLKGIQGGIDYHRLITAEKELLENTLKQSILLLTEVLSITNPSAFSRALRIRRIISQLAKHLMLRNVWEFELAAMLSQTGCMMIPMKLLDKINSNAALSLEEKKLFSLHPDFGYRLLKDIHRLDEVALMVKYQHLSYRKYSKLSSPQKNTKASKGAQLIKLALDYDMLIQSGYLHQEAMEILLDRKEEYNPTLLEALGSIEISMDHTVLKLLKLESIEPGMVLYQDVISLDNQVLASRYQVVDQSIIDHLTRNQCSTGIVEPILVFVNDRYNNNGNNLNPHSFDTPAFLL